jgi:hippurate hydrolase
MLDEGLLERFPAERVFGLHNSPRLPLGRFAVRKGPAMAAVDDFRIEVAGKGCHAAFPHHGRDPIAVRIEQLADMGEAVPRGRVLAV